MFLLFSIHITTSIYPVPCVNSDNQIADWFGSLAECLHWNVRQRQRQLSITDCHVWFHLNKNLFGISFFPKDAFHVLRTHPYNSSCCTSRITKHTLVRGSLRSKEYHVERQTPAPTAWSHVMAAFSASVKKWSKSKKWPFTILAKRLRSSEEVKPYRQFKYSRCYE